MSSRPICHLLEVGCILFASGFILSESCSSQCFGLVSVQAAMRARSGASDCSNSTISLFRYPNSSFCFPIVSSEDVDAFLGIFSDVVKIFDMALDSKSLGLGTWSCEAVGNGGTGSFELSSLYAGALAEFVGFAQWRRMVVVSGSRGVSDRRGCRISG